MGVLVLLWSSCISWGIWVVDPWACAVASEAYSVLMGPASTPDVPSDRLDVILVNHVTDLQREIEEGLRRQVCCLEIARSGSIFSKKFRGYVQKRIWMIRMPTLSERGWEPLKMIYYRGGLVLTADERMRLSSTEMGLEKLEMPTLINKLKDNSLGKTMLHTRECDQHVSSNTDI